jgi:putative PIN family toxin of toxin-antitoxin system
MKSLVLDTNVLLDLFVFNDFRAIPLKEALLTRQMNALASKKTLEEFADVLSRPLFSLDTDTQEKILSEWRLIATVFEDERLLCAPWQCQDADDQVFLDLAYTAKPCTLISKDNEVLKLANRAVQDGIRITADYTV